MEVKTLYRRLVLITTCLTFVVVVVGAYVRLMDAGLGCPDWPGCYGALTPAHAEDAIARAVDAQGGDHGPVSLNKAWKEMFHRYLAGGLGLLILGVAIVAWRWRDVLGQSAALAASLPLLVALQVALGMWTVTLLLKPVIVTMHLLGGMAMLALLAWLSARQWPAASRVVAASRMRPLRLWAAVALVIVVVQIALGGWVSTNYAALACIDFPTCHGVWRPDMDFEHGFQLTRELGKTAAGTYLAYDALTAIHWTHRVGALITLLVVGATAVMLWRVRALRGYGAVLAAVLLVQISLGIVNVMAGLPLAIAAAHNAVAAVLLVTLVVINFVLSQAAGSTRSQRTGRGAENLSANAGDRLL